MNIIYIHLFEARAEFVFSKLKSGDYEETGEDRRDQGSKILGRDANFKLMLLQKQLINLCMKANKWEICAQIGASMVV